KCCWCLLAGAGLMLLALPLLYASRRPPRPELRYLFTKAMCDEIRAGMTFQEVERICGCPVGDYRTRASALPRMGSSTILFCRTAWIDDAVQIIVPFDQDGRAMKVECWPVVPVRESVADKVRRILGL